VRFVQSEYYVARLDYIATVDVKNLGNTAQRKDIFQHLAMFLNNSPAGTQAIPGLRVGQSFTANFPFQQRRTKHKPRPPVYVTFQYVLDDAFREGEKCTSADDRVTYTMNPSRRRESSRRPGGFPGAGG
jgi:hypothetical protein